MAADTVSSPSGSASAEWSASSQNVSRRYAVLMADVQPLVHAIRAATTAGQTPRIDPLMPLMKLVLAVLRARVAPSG